MIHVAYKDQELGTDGWCWRISGFTESQVLANAEQQGFTHYLISPGTGAYWLKHPDAKPGESKTYCRVGGEHMAFQVAAT